MKLAPHEYDPGRVQGRRAAVAAWAKRQDEFETCNVQLAFGVTRANASQILSRLVKDELLVRTGNYSYRSRP